MPRSLQPKRASSSPLSPILASPKQARVLHDSPTIPNSLPSFEQQLSTPLAVQWPSLGNRLTCKALSLPSPIILPPPTSPISTPPTMPTFSQLSTIHSRSTHPPLPLSPPFSLHHLWSISEYFYPHPSAFSTSFSIPFYEFITPVHN
eukprot:c24166_g1_i1 orf=1229-1669(-)